MPTDNAILSELRAAARRLADDARTLLAARWQLAVLEMRAALVDVRRLAVGLAVAVVVATAGLGVLGVAAAFWLSELLGGEPRIWLLGTAAVMIVAGAMAAAWSWRRFSTRFVGFEETLEELHEDALWLREWAPAADGAPPQAEAADEPHSSDADTES